MDQRPILRDHRPTALGLSRHSRRPGGGHPTGLAPRRLKCADPATYQGQRGSESLRPRLGTVLRGTSRREDGRDPGGPMDSAAALEGARRYLSGLQPEDHHGDGVAQPPYRVANPWGQGYDREPRAGASELPSTDPQPRVRCGKAASCEGRSRGLSCMKGNFHVQFLGEGVAATSPPYPTPGRSPIIRPDRLSPEPHKRESSCPSCHSVSFLAKESSRHGSRGLPPNARGQPPETARQTTSISERG